MVYKAIFVLLIHSFAFTNLVDAQSNKIDSLNHVLETAASDSVKIDVLSELFYHYLYEDAKEARKFADQSLKIARKSQDSILIIKSISDYADMLMYQGKYDSSIVMLKFNIEAAKKVGFDDAYSQALILTGNNYWRKGDYQKAEDYMLQNLEFCTQTDNKEGIASSYNNLGNINNDRADYAKALEYYTLSSAMYQEIGMERNHAITLANIGLINMKLEEFEKARDYYQEAKEIFRKISFQLGINFILKNQGIIYKNLKMYDSAIYYYDQAIDNYQKMGEKFEIGQLTHNKGVVYYEMEDMKSAESLFSESLDISQEIYDSLGICMNFSALGNIYYLNKETDKAKRYLVKASAMAKKLLVPMEVIKTEKILSQIYAEEGDFRNAYESQRLYASMQDSIFNDEKQELALEIEARYKTEQKEQEIELLKSENQIQTITIGTREKERYYLIALATVILILMFVIYNRYKIKYRAHRKLKELDLIKSNFFANISHEFRTPLTLIMGPLQNKINLNKNSDEGEEYKLMHRNAEHLLNLINQLLDLSKLDAGKLDLYKEAGDIMQFMKVLVASFTSLADYLQIKFTIRISDSPRATLFDKDVVQKIIYNLLSNAFKFTNRAGKVSFYSEYRKGSVRITVSNSGNEIPEDLLDKIFERFYHSENQPQKGFGIGLSLTKELVELHGGDISASSAAGITAFEVNIPLEETDIPINETAVKPVKIELPEDIEEEQRQTSEEDEKEIVLIVEDHDDLRNYLKNELQELYKVRTAKDGAEGIQLASELIPNLVISDVMMPRVNGMSLCHQLKSNPETDHIPIILLTARADHLSVMEGYEKGADDYIVKPFNSEELKIRVSNLLANRQMLKDKYSKMMYLKPMDIEIQSSEESFLKKAIEIVDKHLDDSGFSPDVFCKEIGLSRMQLHRKLKAITNHSASTFIRDLRLQRAHALLQAGEPVSQIAYAVGFNNLSYFTRSFKERYGVPPSELKKI